MSGADFLDTNVLVYAYQFSEPAKQRIAQQLVRSAFTTRAVISAQVLTEFAATLLHKFSEHVTPQAVIAILDHLSPLRLVLPDGDLVRRAVEARALYGIHFYDAMIVAAAERADCRRILSEDLNSGQEYFGITVANPFL